MLLPCSAGLCVRCCTMHAKNICLCFPLLAMILIARHLLVQDIFDGWGSYVHALQTCDVFQGDLSSPMRVRSPALQQAEVHFTKDPKLNSCSSSCGALPAGIYRCARTAYMLFQQHTTPETAAADNGIWGLPDPLNPQALATYSWIRLAGQTVAMVAPDQRAGMSLALLPLRHHWPCASTAAEGPLEQHKRPLSSKRPPFQRTAYHSYFAVRKCCCRSN